MNNQEENEFLREIFTNCVSYFDIEGNMPLILDLDGRPLTREEIIESSKSYPSV